MPEPREMSVAEAIHDGLDAAMTADPDVWVMGEGVTDPKGIFGTTLGLADRHGADRVMEMPLSENAFTGIAIGAAMLGARPVLVHQRVEFCLLAMEQLINNAAKAHYGSDGAHRAPIVVRLVVGRGWGQGPHHSQSLETMFAAVPGLKVVLPTTAADARGLLLGAIADDSPVMFIEHRWIHAVRGPVPAGAGPLPLDGPKRRRAGDTATVVAASYMTLEAMQAADALAAEGIEVDLFDLRVARPLVLDEVIGSVRRTGRLVVVDLGHRTLGLGAEIAQRITEACFDALKAAPVRIGLPDHPTPSSRSLAAVYYPRATDIADAVAGLIDLENDARKLIDDRLTAARGDLPLDVPHPSFQGPF